VADPHVTDDDWEKFALGELTPFERDAVATHVVACAECGAIYRSIRQLEDEARAFDPALPAAPGLTATPMPAWYAIAAALAVVVIGATTYRVIAPGTTVDTKSTGPVVQLARIEVTPPEVRLSAERALATRGAGDTQAFLEDFGRAIEPYRSGRYADAARLLADVAAKYPAAYEPWLYQGVSALLAGQSGAAEAPLQRAADTAPATMQDEIRWYRAAAFQRTGNIDQATGLLRELCGGASEWRDRACVLVK
jgi:hypothetical protein